MTYEELLKRYRKGAYTPPECLLCLDPGFTTGVAVFRHGHLAHWEQVTTIVTINDKSKVNWSNVELLMVKYEPTAIICEDYKIYQHKLEQHTFSSVDTLRLIGGIDLLAYKYQIPIAYQMATLAKGFCTDEKLQEWGYWQKGMRHSRDAIRHGCYYMLFTDKK